MRALVQVEGLADRIAIRSAGTGAEVDLEVGGIDPERRDSAVVSFAKA